MTIDQQFNNLNDKLQLMLKQYVRLQKDNEKLKAELHQYALREAESKKYAGELQQQISILKAGGGEMTDRDKKEFEKKINQYVKEVDRCISFLSQ